MAHRKGWLLSRFRLGVYALAYTSLLPVRWRLQMIASFLDWLECGLIGKQTYCVFGP